MFLNFAKFTAGKTKPERSASILQVFEARRFYRTPLGNCLRIYLQTFSHFLKFTRKETLGGMFQNITVFLWPVFFGIRTESSRKYGLKNFLTKSNFQLFTQIITFIYRIKAFIQIIYIKFPLNIFGKNLGLFG